MKKIRISLGLMSVICCISFSLAQNPDQADCVKATKQCWFKNMRPLDTTDQGVNALIRLTKKFPNCPHLLTTIQGELDSRLGYQDWFQQSIGYGHRALTIDPTYPPAHLYLARAWEFACEYLLAEKHYQPLINNYRVGPWTDDTQNYIYRANENFITCRFMAKNSGLKYLSTNLSDWDALNKIDLSDKSILERSGFVFLKELITNVGAILVKNSIKGYDPSILFSLNSLEKCIKSTPFNFDAIGISNLSSIVDNITTIISTNNLSGQIAKAYEINKKILPLDLPPSNFYTLTNFMIKDANKMYGNVSLADDERIKDRIKSIDTALQSYSNTYFTSTLLKDSLVYYQHAVESNPDDVKYHWGLASLLEYIGEYGKASQEFKWVIENSSDLKQQANARVHKITCRYMMANAGKKPMEKAKQPDQNLSDNTIKQETQFAEVDGQKVDVSPQAIAERSGWTYLKGLASSIAVAGGVAALGGDARYVEYALNLLTKWIKAPDGQGIQTRNEFIAGMISTFASIIAKHDLTLKLDPIYNPTTSGMPSEGYAGNMQSQFEQGKFEERNSEEVKKIAVNDDISVIEKSHVLNISGEYDCIFPDYATTGTHSMERGSGLQTNGSVFITQNGNNLTLQTTSTVTIYQSAYISGYTTTVKSSGRGVLLDNQSTILFTTTMSTDGYNITVPGNSYSQHVPSRNNTSQDEIILKIINTDELEFSSTDSHGTTRTSRYKKK